MTTTAKTGSLRDALLLNWAEKDREIVVTPEDENRYVIKVSRAIDLLGQATKRDRFQEQLRLLQQMLAKWLQNTNHIKQAFLTLRDGALLFVVVHEQAVYDDSFEDSLSDLDFNIANDVDLEFIEMNAIALPPIPPDSLESFLDPAFTLEYAGHAI